MFNKNLKRSVFVLFFLSFLLFPNKTFASNNSFITIVNPVRISSYIKNPADSLGSEYTEIKKRSLPATWLLSDDALSNPQMLKVISTFDNKQELGIFLEVTPLFAKKAGVVYNARDSWHRAASLFLTGYIQDDRKKLMDRVFADFKKTFGYYPKSVGSWWTDSYSLNYLSKKYQITSNLSVSDQFSLDGYNVWGTYYSTPYYPSNINAAIPAKSAKDKINVVMLRWAPRDPINGFQSPSANSAAMYSPQDYSTIGLTDEYFQKIASFYSTKQENNEFGQLTLGLEADSEPKTFSGPYAKRLDEIINLSQSSSSQFTTSQEFANWYRNKFKNVSPPHMLMSDDFLGSTKKAIWFQNPNYRIGLVYDPITQKLTIRNLISYYSNFEEPFYKSPNRQNSLFINLPYLIDSNIEPHSEESFLCGDIVSVKLDKVKFKKCTVMFGGNRVEIQTQDEGKGHIYVGLGSKLPFPPGKLYVENIGFRFPYGLMRMIPTPLINILPTILFIILLIFIVTLFMFSNYKSVKITLLVLIIIIGLFLLSWKKLTISESELYALNYLQKLPQGIVLVYDKDCLRCTWQTEYEPAAMAGYKNYIGFISRKKIIGSLKLPLAKSPEDIKKEIQVNHAKYIYLAKYEDYIEELPYPAEWVGLKKIYENANAEILAVVK